MALNFPSRTILLILDRWLPLAAAVVGLGALAYLLVQQDLRQGGNDPQIQMAEDAAQRLARGDAPSAVLPANSVALETGLAPFVIIYNEQGDVLASSGLLHGKTPLLPEGVLKYATSHGKDRLTWQPEPGVRIAAVVVHNTETAPGFVLVGRSLREVEKREMQIGQLTVLAVLATLAATLVAVAIGEIAFFKIRQS